MGGSASGHNFDPIAAGTRIEAGRSTVCIGVTSGLTKQSKRQSMSPGKKPPRIDPARVQQEQEDGHKAGIAFATDDRK